MPSVFTPLRRALTQLPDPALLGVLLQSTLLAGLAFAALIAAAIAAIHHLVHGGCWLGYGAEILGGFAASLAALWLFLPAAIIIAGLFMEPVCRAVEARYYPNLAKPTGASIATQIWDATLIGVYLLLLNLAALVLAVALPGAGFLIGLAINAWALGRGLFVAVAMRRMTRRQALIAYDAQRPMVLVQGAILALAGTVPLLNLLIPIAGTAMMLHVALLNRSTPPFFSGDSKPSR